ncbi:MAG TPA: hypothetical protein PKW79_07580 [Rhabdochlamydiaceae bacterium]|nr:hypothetical protein [Rhabdochlamydiaceae bacterium]
MALDTFYRSRLIHDTPLNNFAIWTLQPVRYLAGQRDICIVNDKIRIQTPLHYKYTQESWAKTAQMVALLIPSLILGTIAQAINYFITPEIQATFTLPPESSSPPPPSPFKGERRDSSDSSPSSSPKPRRLITDADTIGFSTDPKPATPHREADDTRVVHSDAEEEVDSADENLDSSSQSSHASEVKENSDDERMFIGSLFDDPIPTEDHPKGTAVVGAHPAADSEGSTHE